MLGSPVSQQLQGGGLEPLAIVGGGPTNRVQAGYTLDRIDGFKGIRERSFCSLFPCWIGSFAEMPALPTGSLNNHVRERRPRRVLGAPNVSGKLICVASHEAKFRTNCRVVQKRRKTELAVFPLPDPTDSAPSTSLKPQLRGCANRGSPLAGCAGCGQIKSEGGIQTPRVSEVRSRPRSCLPLRPEGPSRYPSFRPRRKHVRLSPGCRFRVGISPLHVFLRFPWLARWRIWSWTHDFEEERLIGNSAIYCPDDEIVFLSRLSAMASLKAPIICGLYLNEISLRGGRLSLPPRPGPSGRQSCTLYAYSVMS
jgi:hypothetical protein